MVTFPRRTADAAHAGADRPAESQMGFTRPCSASCPGPSHLRAAVQSWSTRPFSRALQSCARSPRALGRSAGRPPRPTRARGPGASTKRPARARRGQPHGLRGRLRSRRAQSRSGPAFADVSVGAGVRADAVLTTSNGTAPLSRCSFWTDSEASRGRRRTTHRGCR